MATRTWTLCDVKRDQYLESLTISPNDVEGAATGYAITKRSLHGGLRQGVDVIEVDNGTFQFVVVPTRGMGLWHARLGDVSLGWKSPVNGPVHPSFVHCDEPSGIGWLDGFDELLVRCGLDSNGAPEFHDNGTIRYGLHGKIANCPAHEVEVRVDGDSGELTVTGTVDEARLFGGKLRLTSTLTTRVGQPGLTVTDTVTNLSAEPGDLELLYHINFGVPLLEPGSKVVLPAVQVAPRDAVAVENVSDWDTYGPPTPGSSEAVFFIELAADTDGRSQALLRNAAGDQGVSLGFNKNELPCFTLWKNRQDEADGYVTGLEPGINFPNTKSFEKQQGRVAVLAPGESRSFEIAMEALASAESVASAERRVVELQGSVSPKIRSEPDPEWSQA